MRILAIIAAFNEEDVIAQVVGALVDQGILVYVLDNHSTDGTAAALLPYLGRGLLEIETFPEGATQPAYEWERLLRRKEELANELDADWFLHHDADEFREGPWTHLTLAESIGRVDGFGYNAIDFEVLTFLPTHDDYRPGQDLGSAFPYYEPGRDWDKVQVRCWKKGAARVDLTSTGGHAAIFPGRNIFPIRFILRHYPFRGQAQAARKVFRERLPRFLPSERARGWHQQYDRFKDGQRFIWHADTLVRYDPELVRLQLMLSHRRVEELEASPDAQQRAIEAAQQVEASLSRSLDQRNREVERLGQALDERNRHLAELERAVERLAQLLHDRDTRVQELDQTLQESRRRLDAVLASKSWRWTRALRVIQSFLRRG